MMNIWVISDTHFFHYNILSFKNREGELIRPFSTVKEMNDLMVENWNAVVKDEDIIYHLGDLYFGSLNCMKDLMKQLKGRKRLIVGNHDNIKVISRERFFQKIQMWRMFPEFGLLLTHVPVHNSTLEIKGIVNVHGHTHCNPSPTEKHINVCVEATNYAPINIEDLRIK